MSEIKCISCYRFESSKVFDGTAIHALSAGWQRNNFGWVCTDCSGSDFAEEYLEKRV